MRKFRYQEKEPQNMNNLAVFVIAAIASLGLGIALVVAETSNETITELRDDGVVVVHNPDGSKLYKVNIQDGLTSDSNEIETHLNDLVNLVLIDEPKVDDQISINNLN